MQDVIGDTSKFQELPEDPTAQRESKLQRFLYSLKQKGCLTEAIYQQIRPTGSKPARSWK